MSKPKEPRAKAPPRYGNGTHPQRAPKNNFFATLMSTPEGRALRKEWSKRPRKNPGRPKGVPDGYRKNTIEPLRQELRGEAEKVVEVMTKKLDVNPDEYATEALVTAVEIMRSPDATRDRLSAARLVLDFTKQKPASKSEMAISQAESFLEGLLQEEQTNGQKAEANQEETTH